MDIRLKAAVLDNARWCHLVCASQGIVGRFDDDAWVSARRTPPMYPDAVTLTDDVASEALLARIDRTAGCSVKDSFSTLDLSAAGSACSSTRSGSGGLPGCHPPTKNFAGSASAPGRLAGLVVRSRRRIDVLGGASRGAVRDDPRGPRS
jgi:hypothetical protein